MSLPRELLDELRGAAPRFDSVSQAVYWLRWQAGLDRYAVTHYVEPEIGYQRSTEHVEIHLAYIYLLAELLYREQNIFGV